MRTFKLKPKTTRMEEEIQLTRKLSQGLREIAAGNTRPAREVFAELREEYGIRD